jgi:hypothetical protein
VVYSVVEEVVVLVHLLVLLAELLEVVYSVVEEVVVLVHLLVLLVEPLGAPM